ncbi:MAG: cysteine--tRNA ligase [Conexivisphaerales archaeon]
MGKGLEIFNTLTMKKDEFSPIASGSVRMFVCGPTVNDLMHMGNARTYVFYDTVARYLDSLGYRTNFIMNVTDIDESIIFAARKARMSVETFIRKYISEYLKDLKSLKINTIKNFERVSKYVEEMKTQIQTLLERGYAYRTNSEVYFEVSKFPRFGALSHSSLDELSLRPTELAEGKKNPVDFALWRQPPVEEIAFESPWGRGWPGWHIQDTAYTISNLGDQYDIHGGARELIYPHHEAEIAQAEALTGKTPFVKYWIHCGLLTTEGKKMSKSEGNVVYARDIVRKYGSDATRLFLLYQHHRESFEFDERVLMNVMEEYVSARKSLSPLEKERNEPISRAKVNSILEDFFLAMNDDFNTPEALDSLQNVIMDAMRAHGSSLADYYHALKLASQILGVKYVE